MVYSKIEDCTHIDQIAHPAVREVLRSVAIEQGVEIHHDGDLPARSGIGSSSSFAVGILHAIHALQGYMPTKSELAKQAIELEQDRLQETVGSQDQVFAAHGGLNQVDFLQNDEIVITPVTLKADRLRELNSHLMLFFSGISRTASTIAKTYVEDLASKERQLQSMGQMVDEAMRILRSEDLDLFGKLLHEGWQAKRSLDPGISTSYVDELYSTARSKGALGGKLLGAGGGGFVLLYVRPDDQAAVKAALSKLIHVPFHFDFSGSRIIFFDHGEDYSEQSRYRQQRAIAPFRDADQPAPIRPSKKAR